MNTYAAQIDPTDFWTYNRITVEHDLGNGYVEEESYYEMKTDSGAYKVKIQKLTGTQGCWFVWVTHREDSADVEVFTNFRSAWSHGYMTLKAAKRVGTAWVRASILAAA